ncbi:unnamed protein product [Strongylus vulgaris]|uniref:Uncharacterized protein n=1 Tax=Strongylus vulgaris TaxID=40348 RepID=A0A3P7K9P5_STRVU|nr:unnamed protein product [Strongylus vulgaris]
MADNQDDTIECLTPVVELSLPSADESADVYDIDSEKRSSYESAGAVVFRRRHRAGIRIEVKNEDPKPKEILSLLVKYKNEQCSMNVNVEPEWRLARVRIALAPPC